MIKISAVARTKSPSTVVSLRRDASVKCVKAGRDWGRHYAPRLAEREGRFRTRLTGPASVAIVAVVRGMVRTVALPRVGSG